MMHRSWTNFYLSLLGSLKQQSLIYELRLKLIKSIKSSLELPHFFKKMFQQPMLSFHQRPLPSHCVAFSSMEGRRLLVECLADSPAYFPLAEQFHTQSEPAFCGLGTLVMALNALRIDPGRHWKGPWRWFHEEMLDCCVPAEVVKSNGITLDEFVCLAACNGAQPALHRHGVPGIDEASFRAAVVAACASSLDDAGAAFVVVSYDRHGLGQSGSGHFSPIGAYHAASDQVLVLDVARFKYPPHWVALPLLFAAMAKPDAATEKPRGYVVLRRREVRSCSHMKGSSGAGAGVLSLVPPPGGCMAAPDFFAAEAFGTSVVAALRAVVSEFVGVDGNGSTEMDTSANFVSRLAAVLVADVVEDSNYAALLASVQPSAQLDAPPRSQPVPVDASPGSDYPSVDSSGANGISSSNGDASSGRGSGTSSSSSSGSDAHAPVAVCNGASLVWDALATLPLVRALANAALPLEDSTASCDGNGGEKKPDSKKHTLGRAVQAAVTFLVYAGPALDTATSSVDNLCGASRSDPIVDVMRMEVRRLFLLVVHEETNGDEGETTEEAAASVVTFLRDQREELDHLTAKCCQKAACCDAETGGSCCK